MLYSLLRYFGVLKACARSKSYEQVAVIGLHLCLVCRAVAADLAAFRTAMHDHEALFGVDLGANGLHFAATLGGSVSGIHVKVK